MLIFEENIINGIFKTERRIARSEWIVNEICERVSFLAPVEVFAGEDEMAAMALNAQLMLDGELIPMKYPH